jgi:hypothetical protein
MQSIVDSKLLERLRVGPLAPYLDLYLRRIEQDGFLPSSVPCQLYAIARFSKWLQQGGVWLEDIDEIGVRRFWTAILASYTNLYSRSQSVWCTSVQLREHPSATSGGFRPPVDKSGDGGGRRLQGL